MWLYIYKKKDYSGSPDCHDARHIYNLIHAPNFGISCLTRDFLRCGMARRLSGF